ncbi:LuxR C-terminal-related transcriptional regulator [Sphaerimonospora cavernae]|uniref:LuxR C-terminal-related transcriptional regulator n=1 Tax=Sphaerimonospora cavernae TaxID=1740611 RepID=A0ABV6U484_9ACTN
MKRAFRWGPVTGPARARTAAAAFVALIMFLGLGAALALEWARESGVVSYLTNPVGMIAVAGSATVIAVLAMRRPGGEDGRRPSPALLRAESAVLLAYLVLAAVAVTAHRRGWSVTPLSVSLWGAWWIAPPAGLQVIALRMLPLRRSIISVYVAVIAVAMVLQALLSEPQDPFVGVPPAAPQAWVRALPVDIGAALVLLASIAACVVCVRDAVRSSGEDRVRAVCATVCASIAPLVFIVCVGLAVAREPGQVSPTAGSIAYLVMLGFGCVAGVAVTIRNLTLNSAGRILAAAVSAYAVVAVVIGATLVAGLLAPAGSFMSAVTVVALTVGVVLLTWRVAWALTARLEERDSPDPARRLPDLSAREREVLALVADGARDAEIARVLFLSERTVEAHLRRIYQKLGLEPEPGRNRRWLAARAWIAAGGGSEAEIKGNSG